MDSPSETGECASERSEFRLPADCNTDEESFNCEYYASWTFLEETDSIEFVLKVSIFLNIRPTITYLGNDNQ